jgi:hypothetical protein
MAEINAALAAAASRSGNSSKHKPSTTTAQRHQKKRLLGRTTLIFICIVVFGAFYFGRDLLLTWVTRLDNWLGEDEPSSTAPTTTNSMANTPTNSSLSSSTKNSAKNDKNKNKNKIPPWANKKGSAAIPDYDVYVQYATEMGWQPTDPLEKLQDTLRKYPQIFDLVEGEREQAKLLLAKAQETATKLKPKSASKGSNNHEGIAPTSLQEVEEAKIDEYLEILQEEVKFLLKILMKATDNSLSLPSSNKKREIDLTEILHSTLDMMNQCYYRIMKHRIQLNSPR